jgi:hypothetical protein
MSNFRRKYPVLLKKKARERRQVMVYFALDEMPVLEGLMDQEKRDASSLIRWLVTEFGAGGLLKAGDKAQRGDMAGLKETLRQLVDSQSPRQCAGRRPSYPLRSSVRCQLEIFEGGRFPESGCPRP